MQEITAPPLSKAEENCLRIAGLVKKVHYYFLELGGLLLENQEFGYWGVAGAESFKDFVQQLGLSYTRATEFMGLMKLALDNVLTKEEQAEIGPAKSTLLLHCAKKGKLTDEIKLLARDCTWNDLRLALGHNLVHSGDSREYMLCPRCGGEIEPINTRCRCGEEIIVKISMIRRR